MHGWMSLQPKVVAGIRRMDAGLPVGGIRTERQSAQGQKGHQD